MCEICPKLTIKTVECQRHSDVFIVNFEKIYSIIAFKLNTGWDECTRCNQT